MSHPQSNTLRLNSQEEKTNYWLEDHSNFLLAHQGNESESSPLVYTHCRKKECRFVVFENLIEIEDYSQRPKRLPPPERKTDDISRFSPSSRMRMMRVMSSVQLSTYSSVYHCILTFHNDFPEDSITIKKIFHLFWIKLQNAFPHSHFVWRLDFQKRGAPHYHILCFMQDCYDINDKIQLQNNIGNIWRQTIQDDTRYTKLFACKVTSMADTKQFFMYVSKYSAKVEDKLSSSYRGRRWGYSDKLRTAPCNVVIVSENFMEFFKRKLYQFLNAKFKRSDEFNTALFDSVHFSVFLSREEFISMYTDAKLEFENQNV